jgi:MFS family permease
MIILASLGGSLEFYDFIIYGIFAPYIASQFFPSSDPGISLILTFSVFAAGFVIRPLGGVVMSHFGDRYGRRNVFVASVLVISLATMAIGALPSYATWGTMASVALVALRLVQGFCLGGELPGVTTYAMEAAPKRAGLACAIIIVAVNLGIILGTLVSLAIHHFLSPQEAAGWRLAFFIGGILGLVTFRIQKALEETPEFKQMRGGVIRLPLAELLKQHGRKVIAGTLFTATVFGFNGILFSHIPAYLVRQLGYTPEQASLSQNACVIVQTGLVIAIGYVCDKVSRHRLLQLSALFLMVGTYPFYRALIDHSANLLLIFALAGVATSLAVAVFGSLLAELFPTRVRFSGVALTYSLGATIFNGFAPLIATWLIRETGSALAPASFIVFCAGLSFVVSLAVGRSDRPA